MSKVFLFCTLVALLSGAQAKLSWGENEYVSDSQKYPISKTYQYPISKKLTPEEEDKMKADIMQKLKDNGDIDEILVEVDTLVRLSPSTPENVNFTALVQQLKNQIRENMTKTLETQLQENPEIYNIETTRYKRSNETYNTCITVIGTVGFVGGGASGATIAGIVFSIVPVLGTGIGALLGAALGGPIGREIAVALGKQFCPK